MTQQIHSNIIGDYFKTEKQAEYNANLIYEIIIQIFRVVDGITPLMVAQQNIARPDWPAYGTLLVVNDQLVGLPETLERDITGDVDIENIVRQRRHATLSVNFYRDNAMGILNNFMAAWFSMGGIEIQRDKSMGFRGFSSVRNLTTAVHENFESRAQVDLHISYIHQFYLTHDTIGAWNIDGYVLNDTGATHIDVTLTEPTV